MFAGPRKLCWVISGRQETRRNSGLELQWSQTAATFLGMADQDENPPRYRWPWFVLVAVVLGVVLAIAWMSFAVQREKQERDVNAPLPSVPAH